ncbi:MAG: class I SAM-dependent methyltransferase [Calditrichota bacterium]
MDRVLWVDTICPFCPEGSVSNYYCSTGDRLREPLLENYRLVRCASCSLVYLNPRPSFGPKDDFYREEGYDPFLSMRKKLRFSDRVYTRARRWTLNWKRRLIQRWMPAGARILDVGCGTGEFLNALKQDYQVQGIEPESQAAEWARREFGLLVSTGTLLKAGLADGSFDMITLWHVLEHVPEPLAELAELHRLLTPTGRLLLALPNIGSVDARTYRRHWVALDAPRHIWHFQPSHIKLLAARGGFRLLDSGMMPLDTFYNALWSERIKYQVGGVQQALRLPIRLPFAVTASLIVGGLTGQHSGIWYVLAKT